MLGDIVREQPIVLQVQTIPKNRHYPFQMLDMYVLPFSVTMVARWT
jgi:hypothetical protein